MKKSMKKGGATPPRRELTVCALDQIRGGAIVVQDPGGAGNVVVIIDPITGNARRH